MSLNFGRSLFPSRGELIETFDFSDIATGLGFELFYGTPAIDSSGTTYSLLPNAVASNSSTGTSSVQIGVGTKTMEFDSSVFNLPRTAKGTAYISMIKQSSVTLAQSIKAQIAIVHADLSVTNISSEFETTQTLAISPTKTTDLLALPLTQTTIKKGEKLRMILKIVIDASGGNGFLFHDNADSTKILHLLMPFRIES